MSGPCKSIVELSEEILLACLIEGNEISDYYARKGVPVLNKRRSSIFLTQTRLIMSMVLEGQEYMGRLKYTHFHMENADGLHFPLGKDRIFAVMLKPQPITDSLVSMIRLRLEKLAPTI